MSQDTEDLGELGDPHPTDTDPNTFTASDPNADVGEPGDLGAQIGLPNDPTGT